MEESTPLLFGRRAQLRATASRFQAHKPRTVVLLLSCMIFCLSFSGSLSSIPATQLLEDNICRRYYDSGVKESSDSPIDERLCKSDAVQSKLAYLNGWQYMIEAIVGILLAFPYGALADKIGRKPILFLSLVGFTLSSAWMGLVLALGQKVPVHIILFSPAFVFIGGGSCVLVSVLSSAVADVTNEDTRASAFLTISLGSLVGGFLGPAVASVLMQATSPWVPFLGSFGAMLLSGLTMIFVPETLPPKKVDPDEEPQVNDTTGSMFRRHLRHSAQQLQACFTMLRRPALVIVLVSFLSPVPTAIGMSQLFVQYVSKRFEWSLASAGYLISVRGTINVLLLLIVLPGVSKLLLSSTSVKGLSVAGKDRLIAQISAVFLTLGCLLIAGNSISLVIGGLVVNTLGAGLSPMCRSLAASFVDAHDASKLQTMIGITEAISSLVAGPTLAGLFSKGMKLEVGWMGLPYVCLAAFLALTTLPIFFLRLPAKVEGELNVNEVNGNGNDYFMRSQNREDDSLLGIQSSAHASIEDSMAWGPQPGRSRCR